MIPQKRTYCRKFRVASTVLFVITGVVAAEGGELKPPEVTLDNGGVRKATDKLKGRLLVKTAQGDKRLAKEVDGRLNVTEKTQTGKTTRTFQVVRVSKGKFRHEHFLSGMKYRITLPRRSIRASRMQCKGEWTFTYPAKTDIHKVNFTVQDIPYSKKELTIKIQYTNSSRPINDASVTLKQFKGKERLGMMEENTSKKGEAHFSIAHVDGTRYQAEFSMKPPSYYSYEDNPEKCPFPPLESYKTDQFHLQAIGKSFVWKVKKRQREKTLVVNIKGDITPVKKRYNETEPALVLLRRKSPDSFFEGIRTKERPDGTLVKRIGNLSGDKIVMRNIVYTKNGVGYETSHRSGHLRKKVDGAHLKKVKEGHWRAELYNNPEGQYLFKLVDTKPSGLLNRNNPVSITPESELPVRVEYNLKEQQLKKPKQKKASITGKITDQHGKSVKGAEVRVSGFERTTVTSNAQGIYTAENLVPGIYHVLVVKHGAANRDTITRIKPGQNRLNFSTDRSPSFRGRVMTPEGEPAFHADIRAVLLRKNEGAKTYDSTTGPKGKYELPVPANGAVYGIKISTRKNRHAKKTQRARRLKAHCRYIEKRVTGPRTQLNVTLRKTVNIQGHITFPEKIQNSYKFAGVTLYKNLRQWPLNMAGTNLRHTPDFKMRIPPGKYTVYFFVSGTSMEGNYLSLGTLTVPENKEEITFRKQITTEMLKNAVRDSEFVKKVKKAKSGFKPE